ncbi:MAG: hypothetical protein U0R64_09275 [Candidatus Nanopelagicales bacterium]
MTGEGEHGCATVRGLAQVRRIRQRPFTIPGHKRRGGLIDPALGRLLDADVPLYGGADTVKMTTRVLGDAERRAAALWGADLCLFTTQGSTHANVVTVLATCRPGVPVAVARNCHRSVLSGVALAGARPVWLPIETDPITGVQLGVAPATLDAALRDHPDVSAVFLTDPSYRGSIGQLSELIDRAHQADVPVVVDQAWGAHLGLAPGVPRHALQRGADAMVTSAHKMLPAFSQAALILTRGDRIDPDRVHRAFDATHTTSPSAAILASIDVSRAWLAAPEGRAAIARVSSSVAEARERLRSAGFSCPGPDDFPSDHFDPLKLTVGFAGGGSGNAAEEELLHRGMPVEMADRDVLIAQVGLLDDREVLTRLVDGIIAGAGSLPPRPVVLPTFPIPPADLTPGEAFAADYVTLPLAEAIGCTSAELVAPYPPGVAVIVPGERVTSETVDALLTARAAGNRIAYAADPTLATLQVVA